MSDTVTQFSFAKVPPAKRGRGAGRPARDLSAYREALLAAKQDPNWEEGTGIVLATGEDTPHKGNQTWQKQGLQVVSRSREDGKFDYYVELWDESMRKPRKPRTKKADASKVLSESNDDVDVDDDVSFPEMTDDGTIVNPGVDQPQPAFPDVDSNDPEGRTTTAIENTLEDNGPTNLNI